MPVPTVTQVSSGGVSYRYVDDQVEVALIQTGFQGRWQLPKGAAKDGESMQAAAIREVREETGLQSELVDSLGQIEYWYYSSRNKHPVRFHKYVWFFLMKYISGKVEDHDHEVIEARWVEINQAVEMLSFQSEKDMVRKARRMLEYSDERNLEGNRQTTNP